MRLLTPNPLSRLPAPGKAIAKAGWAACWRQRLRSLAVAILLVAQCTLALHQLGHHSSASAAAGDTCVLCQLTSTMAASPDAVAVTPSLHFVVERRGPESLTQLIPARLNAGFLSRAPPTDFRI